MMNIDNDNYRNVCGVIACGGVIIMIDIDID